MKWNHPFSFSISSTGNKKNVRRVWIYSYAATFSVCVAEELFAVRHISTWNGCWTFAPSSLSSLLPASLNSTAAKFDPLATDSCKPWPRLILMLQLWGSFTGHLCKFPLPRLLVLSAINNALGHFMKIKRKKEGLLHNKCDSLAAKQSAKCLMFFVFSRSASLCCKVVIIKHYFLSMRFLHLMAQKSVVQPSADSPPLRDSWVPYDPIVIFLDRLNGLSVIAFLTIINHQMSA